MRVKADGTMNYRSISKSVKVNEPRFELGPPPPEWMSGPLPCEATDGHARRRDARATLILHVHCLLGCDAV
jgi:hypothetical protein